MNNFEFSEIFKKRTKEFALKIIRLNKLLSRTTESQVIGRQLIRSSTSVAAKYRAVCRSRSRREFVAKISIVVEEADETVFWLELLMDSGCIGKHEVEPLLAEAGVILSILSAARKTAKNQQARNPNL
jgi:four helix bundle protein